MRSSYLAIITLGLTLTGAVVPRDAAAQQVLDVRILGIASRTPAPPAGVEDAFRRARCDDQGSCTVTTHYAAATRELEDVQKRIQALAVTLQQPAAHPLAGMDPAELQRRLAGMTRDEQIRFAQQMAAAAAGGVQAPEPPAVQRLLAEATKVQERAGEHTIAVAARRIQPFDPEGLERAVRAKHDEIRARTARDINALPQPPAYAASPVIAEHVRRRREIEDRGMQERFAAEQDYQKALADAWQKELARLRDFYGAFEDAMAANGFGASAVGTATKLTLVQQQGVLAAHVEQLLKASADASQRGAQLWMEKVIMERERSRN